ncbi:Hypothetical predicted protein [Pelobates cultripes]|uniref:Uncharacterized protein n=1 Tax=Pelobates cultripes TaxID=61616 RepID=A0AAD1R6Y2_PELCU|nr:Hypothetical predicted protein [Pelobates cultripes]
MRPADKMAAASLGAESGADSEQGSARGEALSHITAELAAISANMLTKKDKTTLVTELRAAIREEIMAVRKDLTALEDRVTELERENLQALQHSQAADHATARQGSVLLELRRQVEDLDNNARRNNIRVKGLPEADNEDLGDVLPQLEAQPMRWGFPMDLRIRRAPTLPDRHRPTGGSLGGNTAS